MRTKLFLIFLLFCGITCQAQISDSIRKIKQLLQGTWVDSLRPDNYYSFSDSEITIGYSDLNNSDSNGNAFSVSIWRYKIDTFSMKTSYIITDLEGKKTKYPPCKDYYISALIPNFKDTVKEESLDAPPRDRFRADFYLHIKNRLYLYFNFSEFEVNLIRRE